MGNRINFLGLKSLCLTLLLLVVASVTFAAPNFPSPQTPPRLVNDFADLLSRGEERALEEKLVAFSDTTSTQIAIVTIEDLEGMAASQYATELAHQWQIGEEGKDNGVLILVKPKTLLSKGEVFIAVGYGLEGAIPDVMASRIVRNVLIPAFQQNAIYAGLDKSVDVLISLATGEYQASTESEGGVSMRLILIVILIILIVSLFNGGKNGGGRTYDSRRSHGVPIFPIFPMGGGSSWGGSSGGSSFGGGGFGGFGGGGFGGGGAGGSW